MAALGDNVDLPLAWQHGEKYDAPSQLRDDIEAEGLFGIHCCCCKVSQPYAHMVNWAHTQRYPVSFFSYDWRRDLHDAVNELELHVADVIKEHHAIQVQLVGHSMGGLVIWAFLRRRPDLVHSILSIACPFGPCAAALGNLEQGKMAPYTLPTGLYRRMTSREAHFSWVSPMAWFSDFQVEDAQNPKPVFAEAGRGAEQGIGSLYDIHTWREKHLGFFRDCEQPTEEQIEHCKHVLETARRFHAETFAATAQDTGGTAIAAADTANGTVSAAGVGLQGDDEGMAQAEDATRDAGTGFAEFKYPPITCIVATGYLTVDSVRIKAGGADWNDVTCVDGDGFVTAASQIPGDVPYRVATVSADHMGAANEIETIAKEIELLRISSALSQLWTRHPDDQ